MNEPLVRDWMTRDPIVVTGDAVLPMACHLMKTHRIRHLPVVQDGRVVGIVTWGDIREASASDADTLSAFELTSLLTRLPVSKVMTRDPITVSAATTITRAAQIMLERKISGLPVTDHGKLIGIITESDIFRMLIRGRAA